jgi:two-component system sensor histidine kinase KdpD
VAEPLRAPRRRAGRRAYLAAAALVAATTGLAALARAVAHVPDAEMLYVLAVVVAAVYLGRGPAIAASTLGVLAYDFFFVLPHFTLDVQDGRYLLTFATMFGIGLVVSSLTERAKAQAVRAETEELRSTLLASVSHDLRTPLAAITGAATTLRDQRIDEATRRELLATLCEEADRMERLVGNLLDMTRLASGAVTPKREWIPVDELVGAALARVERQLERHRVRTVVPEHPALVSVDPVLVEQLIVNLLDNAARHTPAGTEVEVRAEARGGALTVDVADGGPGIAEPYRARVFDRFQRGSASTGRGAGLGLAIARAIAEVHGGRLTLAERPGGGALFRLELPPTGASPSVPHEPTEPGHEVAR